MNSTAFADANGVGRKDVYTKVTERIISDLEQGVRPWMKPWSAEHAAGRITKPLRHNGTPYRGMNILLLWGEAMAKGYGAPIWMTYKQAQELGGQVRKGEHGCLVVYANTISKTETNEQGEDVEREIPFIHEGLYRVQRRAGGRLARPLLRAAREPLATIRAHRARRAPS